jgi:hypothetical protein
MLPNMPEHHKEEEIYFGEDYYVEDYDDSNLEEIHDNPYAEADRLAKLKTK